MTDLRLGVANNLAFQFVLATMDDEGQWQLLESPTRHPSERGLQQLETLWQRLKGDQNIDANLQRIDLSYSR
ncbi:hypothetical protein VSVS05_03677 [Vibrio scophthalmi]|uniref:Uncharacterized protein n=1 Tax=Vibrio scophthalmi TaxID=45658 RepID=A0A1C7FH85_9VIBR|nr:hypothetical protein VSVS05_03677 [Vibrio scophthalmi]